MLPWGAVAIVYLLLTCQLDRISCSLGRLRSSRPPRVIRLVMHSAESADEGPSLSVGAFLVATDCSPVTRVASVMPWGPHSGEWVVGSTRPPWNLLPHCCLPPSPSGSPCPSLTFPLPFFFPRHPSLSPAGPTQLMGCGCRSAPAGTQGQQAAGRLLPALEAGGSPCGR